MRILHIEDDAMIARSIGRMLARYLAADVFNADTADAAIELLKTNSYDLVISDYDLKVGTGGDVLQWVKDNRPAQRWLFLSGNSTVETLGAPYVVKPAPVVELMDAIRSMMV